MTLRDLLEVQPGPWQDAAARWRRLAAVLDDADEKLIQGTRDLPEAWRSGAAATAAATRATALRTRVSETYPPLKNIGDQLDLHGYAMVALRQQAEQVIAAARQAGYTVDTAAGTVTAPAAAYTGSELARTVRETGLLADDLRRVVERARAQDADTARLLGGNAPSALGGSWAGRAGVISRAEELALKIKNPGYHPTAAELGELRKLIGTYGEDPAFAYELLTTLGPKGLLELNGTLATYQLDRPGEDPDGLLFDGHTADTVKALQAGLGAMLETATEAGGTRTGPRGETYQPGRYELPGQWVADLMTAGRSTMTIGDPASPGRYLEGVYGYQLLGPLLHNPRHDPAFIAAVGGDMIDFERRSGEGSDLWTRTRGENVRLDWTWGHDDNTRPAGWDPVNALMDGLSNNGAGTRDMLLGATEPTTDPAATSGTRLPRLDYLLTDRDWPTDAPGGPGWAADIMANGDKYTSVGLDKFGEALERATVDHPGEGARRLIEGIVYETNVDEQAMGYADGADPKAGGQSEQFKGNNLVAPELRDSMGQIMRAYIVDVNHNLAPGHPVTSDQFDVDDTHLRRFLADLGKDETAHRTIAQAESAYATAAYRDILSGAQNPDADLRDKVDAMKTVSHNYGEVLGTIDVGAALERQQTGEELDAAHNDAVETRYKVVSPLVELAVDAATSKVPGGGLANEAVGEVLSKLEESAKVDNKGRVDYETGGMLGTSRADAVAVTEMSLYHSGKLENLPADLLGPDGRPVPIEKWADSHYDAWRYYKSQEGAGTVGRAASDMAESYQSGYGFAQNVLGTTSGGKR